MIHTKYTQEFHLFTLMGTFIPFKTPLWGREYLLSLSILLRTLTRTLRNENVGRISTLRFSELNSGEYLTLSDQFHWDQDV